MPKKAKASSSKKKSQLKPKKKSICHLSSDEESEGYDSDTMSVDKRTPAPARGRKRLSKPKRSMFEEESDEDDFMF